MKIKMTRTVTPGLPYYGKSGTILYNNSTYEAIIKNSNVYGICGNSEMLRLQSEDYILIEE